MDTGDPDTIRGPAALVEMEGVRGFRIRAWETCMDCHLRTTHRIFGKYLNQDSPSQESERCDSVPGSGSSPSQGGEAGGLSQSADTGRPNEALAPENDSLVPSSF